LGCYFDAIDNDLMFGSYDSVIKNMSETNKFCCQLGLELQDLFGGTFKFYKSKLELRRKFQGGYDVIIINSVSKWSPYISIAFYFGRNFDAVRLVEKKYGLQPSFYHIVQYSMNALKIPGLDYSRSVFWRVDITNPPSNLAEELMIAIKSIAYPFFDRFCDLKQVRDAMIEYNPWCFDARGGSWSSLLKIDMALNDVEHFRAWSSCLEPFFLEQANKTLEEWSSLD
jgi:hypothetical protein